MLGDLEIWAGPLSRYRFAVVLLNRGPSRTAITAHWDDIGIPPTTSVVARELWEVCVYRAFFVPYFISQQSIMHVELADCFFFFRVLCLVNFLQHKTLKARFVENITATVDSHACKMYILKPVS